MHCRHQEGYKKTRDKTEACKICSKVKDVDESYYLLPKEGIKKLGKRLKPDSRKTFKNKNEAKIVNDTIDFYGVLVNVDVHNSYKSSLFSREINDSVD